MVLGIDHPRHLDAGKSVIADSLRPSLQSGPAFHRFRLDAEAFARFRICHPEITHGGMIGGEGSPGNPRGQEDSLYLRENGGAWTSP